MVIWDTQLLPKSEYILKEELKLTLSDGKLQSYTNVCIYTAIFICIVGYTDYEYSRRI